MYRPPLAKDHQTIAETLDYLHNSIEALKMLTTWGAHAEFNEHKRGKIKIGFDADFTVLSNDITTCSPQDILNTEIIMTIVNGRIVYKN